MYHPSDSEEWLRNFNAQHYSGFLKVDEMRTNDLVIVPEATYHNYLKRANEMKESGELQTYYASSMQDSNISPEGMLFLLIIGTAFISDDDPSYNQYDQECWKQQVIEKRIKEAGGVHPEYADHY